MANKAADKPDKTEEKARGAEKALLEELFNDYYKNRKKIYRMNFVRGIFFGFGGALGGTVVIALLVWLLSLFVDFPLIGELIKDAQNTLDKQ